MRDRESLHEYRIRLGNAGREVRAVVDRRNQMITLELPEGPRVTVDVVTARAAYMLLHQAVYASLEPTGPYLRLESNCGTGWALVGPGR
jgi:hypothetical protein